MNRSLAGGHKGLYRTVVILAKPFVGYGWWRHHPHTDITDQFAVNPLASRRNGGLLNAAATLVAE